MRTLTSQLLIWCCWLLLAACPCATTAVAADGTRTLTQSSENLRDAIWLLEDPGGNLSIEAIRTPEVQARFKPWDPSMGDVNLSFSPSAWWIRVRLQRDTDTQAAWILNVAYAFNKFIDFHAPGAPPVLTGHGRPLENRPILSQHFAFPITLSDTPQDFHFRVASSYAVSLPLEAWQPGAYATQALKGRLLQALYHGVLITLMLYAAISWLSSRDRRFGYYALYGAGLNVSMMSGNGWGGLLFWPTAHKFDEVASVAFLSLTIAAMLLLIRSVLETHRTVPGALDRAMRWAAGLAVVHAALTLASMGHAELSMRLFQGLLVLSMMLIALVVASIWFARGVAVPGKRFFVASWIAVAFGAIVGTLRVIGWLPTNVFTSYSVQISTAVEMLLLSFMLGSIRLEERRRSLETQARRIEELREQELRLERSVEERTRELAATADSERRTLAEFLRFAALVSHEFRNGLNVISAQSDILRRQTDDPVVSSRTQIIRQHVLRLAKLTDTWLKSDQILNAPAPTVVEAIDCRQWIAELLNDQRDLHAAHDIEYSVADDAQTLWADRQLLEVVLVNLLGNACKYSAPGTRVTIRTRAQTADQGVAMTGLQVQDQGPGIDPALQSRIFERYFRVHPEGPVSGTGLGLSFVRHIADLHGGRVELTSELGHGSTFTVWFPNRGSSL